VSPNLRRNRSRAVIGAVSMLLAACASVNSPVQGTGNQASPKNTESGADNGRPALQPSATLESKSHEPATASDKPRTEPDAASAARAENEEPAPGSNVGAPANKPRLVRGNDEVIAPAKPRQVRPPASQEASFKFELAPVREVIHTVLGELLGFTYVLHQPITGTVTLSTAAPIPADQALSILEAVLQANGLLMAQDASGVFHVGPPDALRGVVPAIRRLDQTPLPPGFGTIIVPLKFIGAAEMAEILRPIARPEAFMRVDTIRNLLVMAGSRNQIDGWLEIVRTFDVDLLKGMSVGVFPLQYASVRDIEAAVRAMSPEGSAAPSAAPTAPGAAAPSARQPLLGAFRVIPLERLNSVLVVTPRAAYLDEVKKWIEKLDRPSDTDAEPRLFVYPVQNGSAQHLASVLSGIFARSGPAGSGGDSGVAPGLRAATGATNQSILAGSGIGTGSLAPLGTAIGGGLGLGLGNMPQSGARAGGTEAVTTVSLGSNVRIVGDDLKNAVIIYAPASEFRKIEATLRRLDTPATQVLIEATIVEVSLTDDMQYGLEWYFTNNFSNGRTGTGQLNLNQVGGIGPVQPGFSYTLTNSLGQIRAVLNAFADRSLIRVISSPSLMVLDNHTAAISVGDQQPIKSSDTVTTGGNVTTSIQYKDTGVLLTVTPSVNSGDVVSMAISQSVIDVGSIDIATGQRAFLQRQVSSRVAITSGEAVVLGGLIRDNSTGGSTGLPFLSQIPVLGALFGTQTRSATRTELLIVISPRVIRSLQDAREVGKEMRERMRGFSALVEDQRQLLPRNFGNEVQRAAEPAPSQERGKP